MTRTSEQLLARRLGTMAQLMINAKVWPHARFYSRERVDEIVLLLREAEKFVVDTVSEPGRDPASGRRGE